jgi:cysteinyl-tRNA synthetase
VGNYRTFLYEDILQRYLEYLGYQVQRLINFTDVEDKVIDEMEKTGKTRKELTAPVEKRFFEESEMLRIKLPERIPRSSTSVSQAVKLIQVLVQKGFAYWYGKDVFYDPLKFEGFGKLYGLDMSRWPKKKKRFHKDTYPGQRWNLGDFILWHGCRHQKKECLCWETDVGKGRPAWNIQDPAMIRKHLGYQVDISCGGVDNLYRHHDYTIAVMEAVGGKPFSRFWLHGEHVLVDGAKMSKSKENTVYVENLLEKGLTAEHIRFFLIQKHYRKKLNLTEKSLREASIWLDGFNDLVDTLMKTQKEGFKEQDSIRDDNGSRNLKEGFEQRMNDDLDVAGAFDAVFDGLSVLPVHWGIDGPTPEQARSTVKALKKINQVLQVIRPRI